MHKARVGARDAFSVASQLMAPALRAVARRRRCVRVPGPAFLLSFDCDTDEDIAIVEGVHDRVLALGVLPAYAVPGELLERGADVYCRLASHGAEFLNHGHAQHCHIDRQTGRYESSMFYDQLPYDEVVADVRGGHQSVRDVIGTAPVGFRTPHFGTFQRRHQLDRLHDLLAELGYRYSTSTMPLYGMLHGPVVRVRPTLVEIPVTGSPGRPHRPLDTWSYRFAPRPIGDELDYQRAVAELAEDLRRHGGVVNIYADPSQVADWDGFFDSIALLAPFGAPSFSAVLAGAGA